MKSGNPEESTNQKDSSQESYSDIDEMYEEMAEAKTQTHWSINPHIEVNTKIKESENISTQTEKKYENVSTQTERSNTEKNIRDEKFWEDYEKEKEKDLKNNIKDESWKEVIPKNHLIIDNNQNNNLKQIKEETLEEIENRAEKSALNWTDWLYKYFYWLYILLFWWAIPFIYFMKKLNTLTNSYDEWALKKEYLIPSQKLIPIPQSKIFFTPFLPETYLILIITALGFSGFSSLQKHLNNKIKNPKIIFFRKFIYSFFLNIFKRL